MIKSLTIAALAVSTFAGTALAGQTHHRAPADAAAYYATTDRPAAREPAPASAPREDFGSFSAGSLAHSLGY